MNNLLLNNKSKGPGATIYFCKVIRFYASSNTADVVTVDNNISLLGCNIACSTPAGFAYGARYIPTHDDQNSEVEYVNSSGDIYCVAAFLENDYNNAAILGFIFPLETTLSISEYGLYIFRHESDVMWMVRGDGTMQIYHPSGSVIKIGDTIINEMTDQIDTAGLYPAKTDGFYVRPTNEYNANKESNLYINWYKGQKIKIDSLGNIIASTEDTAGNVVATLTMTPDGKATIETTEQINAITKDINVTASGNVVANVAGDVTATVQGDVAANVVGAVTAIVQGNVGINCSQLIDIQGTAGVSIASAGPVAISGASVIIDIPGVTGINIGTAGVNIAAAGPVAISGTSVSVRGATGTPSDSTSHKSTWT